jgi:hypothetical protein
VSDLQCPATFLFAVPADEARARSLAGDLRFRRVAAVYTGHGAGAARTARLVADVLGVRVHEELGLAGPEWTAALEGVADEHRGGTVLVTADAPVLAGLLPSLVPGLPASYGRGLAPGDVVEMRVDADGWVVDSWPRESGSAGRA